ncbi:MAG: hypothetical protein K5859_03550 [Atopobiaceae bacterium]|nr:hypothetical protein [Atopobiaceae bacterium]
MDASYTVTVKYVDASLLTDAQRQGSSQRAAIRSKAIVKPDKASAWKLVKDCRKKAAHSEGICLVALTVEHAGQVVWSC